MGQAPLHRPTDMTRPLDLRHERRTGPERVRRPIYVDHLPPCNQACPAGENIQAWLALAQAGEDEAAWRELVRDNPMPAVHGRVCYHPCEDACNRKDLDASVTIHAVERYLGDLALQKGWAFDPPAASTGKKVLIVGGGPSGLSAAYHLARAGHAVTIHEAGPMAGGMMHFGIPAYRMPRDVLDGEITRILDLGITLNLNHKVTDLEKERQADAFDAVFVAVGAHLSKRVDIPARDAGTMLDAVSFLKSVEAGERPRLGRRVAVYGGGNTAMDAARVVKRLGHEPLIVYRRDRENMPAHDFEAQEALDEGVEIHWLRAIKSLDQTSMTVEIMELDDRGRPRPTGETETIEADDLILALGQDTDTSFLRSVPGLSFDRDGTVRVDERMMTGAPGVFAGGDMVPSERSVTIAVGHGKQAARCIDTWLRGGLFQRPPRNPAVSFADLQVPYYVEADPREQPHRSAEEATSGFEEVVGGLSTLEAHYEAKRCLSCGNCYECDGCQGACPENAIQKLGSGKGYRVDLERCTGCGVCHDQCPVHAIEMIPEPHH
ncbi:NAD(P)-binding protein [Rhodospira trueperi]|uniref:NADPH-dependent glutamate synthase beta chain n=1 Tax=Rhodospira trueperi TaxID=69960 RepID=A0A1G6ZU47_9PROT|nr:NAD(P)-binding protein [Rhodospira trueperi]SDE05355.1 NADPH-dependent glutamate synthase beta chain [Rhodospira trueperi]